VLDIPIAEVTRQYMEYVEIMKEVSLELAAEYLVMAALLAEIKSRMLLPQPEINGQTEEDPRAELIRRLQEYERFKKAALDIDDLPRVGRDIFIAAALSDDIIFKTAEPTVHLQDILLALSDIMKRSLLTASHQIKLEPLSVRDRMSAILEKLSAHDFSDFTQFFTLTEGRLGVVVTFLAMLELLKSNLIQFVQAAPFGPIHLKATT
jgi:segregation and condensation protein A